MALEGLEVVNVLILGHRGGRTRRLAERVVNRGVWMIEVSCRPSGFQSEAVGAIERHANMFLEQGI